MVIIKWLIVKRNKCYITFIEIIKWREGNIIKWVKCPKKEIWKSDDRSK